MKVPTVERKRKFTIALVALAMSFALALLGNVGGGEWVTVTGLIVGLYSGAEAFEGRAHRNG